MLRLANRASMTTITVGTGTLTLGAPLKGAQSFQSAGINSGDLVRYVLEEGDAWEIGTGSYSAAGPTLTRLPSESSVGGSAIPLSGTGIVYLAVTSDDLEAKVDTDDPRLVDAREWSASTIPQTEAEAGSATTRRAWTAERVRQAAQAWWTASADKSKLNGIATGATANAGTVTSVSGGTGLSGSVTSSGTISLLAISAGSTNSGALFYNGTTRSAGRLYGGTTNPASTTRLNYDGALHVSALTSVGDVTAFSDARLKTDIAPIKQALAKVGALNGITFCRTDAAAGNNPPRRYAGLIAQEVETVLPEVVETGSDGLRRLAYGNVVALLVEAIKELSARIDALERQDQ